MKLYAALGILVALLALEPGKAAALPIFAHRFGFECQTCHTTVPQLNRFGEAFLRAGYRIPGLLPNPNVFPVSLKINVAYNSAPGSLPKATVDELEFLSVASLNTHFSFRLEQYGIDGGLPGLTRDAWLRYDNAPFATNALRVLAGQFTLPLPVDPETMRETTTHYAVFDQTIGANPFHFFDPKLGADVVFDGKTSGLQGHIALMQGHDRQSGLPALGLDQMIGTEYKTGVARVAAYRYAGERPLRSRADRFTRQALAAELNSGKFRLNALSQIGFDSSSDGTGSTARSSGSFMQVRWQFSPALTALSRYDVTTNGAALFPIAHSLLLTLVQRIDRNGKFTLEFVSSQPGGQHAVTSALLFAY